MSERFDPYKTWLGVPRSAQPSYYQLFGLKNFESEPPVIAEAAEAAMEKVAAHRNGPQAAEAERILGKLKAAKEVLLSPAKRQAYDRQLRSHLGLDAHAAGSPSAVEATESPTMMLPPGALPPMGTAASTFGAPGGYPQPGVFPPAGGLPQAAGLPAAGGFVPPGYAPVAAAPFPPADVPGAAPFVPFSGLSAPISPPMAPPMPGAPSAVPAAAPPEVGFAPRHTTPTIRRATQRRQQTSNLMVALCVLGGAILLLVIAMVVANKSQVQDTAALPAPQPVVPPRADMEAPPSPAAPPASSTPPSTGADFERGLASAMSSLGSGAAPGGPGELNPAERRLQQRLTADDVIPAMLPEGAKPVPSATGSATAQPAPTAAAASPIAAPQRPAMEAVLPADAVRAKSVQTMFKAVRASLRTRDYAKAEEVALQALVLADAPEVITSAMEQGRIVELTYAFWNGVRAGVKSLNPGDELTYNGKAVKVVRHDETSLVVQQDGKDVPLAIAKFVPGLAVQLAEKGLPPDDPSTKLTIGVFLSVDQAGDKDRGKALIAEAASAGVDAAQIRTLLDVPE